MGTLSAVSAAGDINGDGLDDIIVGATGTNSYAGAAYVIFGSTDGFNASLSLGDLTGEQGFALYGANAGADAVGISANAAGDINGDGYDDILVGSYDVNSGGAGVTYVVYGGDFLDDSESTGTAGADTLIGTADNDVIDGGAGGADVLIGGDGNFERIDGGTGQDTLYLDGNFDLDFTALTNGLVTGIEHIDMNNDMLNVLDIDFSTVLDIGEAIDRLVGEANMLVISKDANDEVNLVGNWVVREEQPQEAIDGGYTVYDSEDSYASVAVQNVADPGQVLN